MRLVAVLTLVLLMPLVPVGKANHDLPHDECANSATAPNPCLHVDLPQSPPGHGKKYYAWLAGLRCQPSDTDCQGRPNQNSFGVPGGGFWGLVYEETNTYPGLQRFAFRLKDNTLVPPDRMVLY